MTKHGRSAPRRCGKEGKGVFSFTGPSQCLQKKQNKVQASVKNKKKKHVRTGGVFSFTDPWGCVVFFTDYRVVFLCLLVGQVIYFNVFGLLSLLSAAVFASGLTKEYIGKTVLARSY